MRPWVESSNSGTCQPQYSAFAEEAFWGLIRIRKIQRFVYRSPSITRNQGRIDKKLRRSACYFAREKACESGRNPLRNLAVELGSPTSLIVFNNLEIWIDLSWNLHWSESEGANKFYNAAKYGIVSRTYANCLEKTLNNKKQMCVVLKAVANIQG